MPKLTKTPATFDPITAQHTPAILTMEADEADEDDRGEPCYVVVDMSPERGERENLLEPHATWPWRVIGDGESLADALLSARDYEHHDVCSHCGRSDGEAGWRVYLIDRKAWELLTCGGPYDDALQPRGDFTWDAELARFVDIGENSCVRCKGTGELKKRDARGGRRRESCPDCEGCGSLNSGDLDDLPDWIEAPESACLWRGDT